MGSVIEILAWCAAVGIFLTRAFDPGEKAIALAVVFSAQLLLAWIFRRRARARLGRLVRAYVGRYGGETLGIAGNLDGTAGDALEGADLADNLAGGGDWSGTLVSLAIAGLAGLADKIAFRSLGAEQKQALDEIRGRGASIQSTLTFVGRHVFLVPCFWFLAWLASVMISG